MPTREPLLKISYRDPEQGWEGMLVIDSLVDGVSGGGCRVTNNVDMNEVTRLARGMSLKNYAMQLPLGGAKCGIRYDPKAPDLADAMTRFFRHVGSVCADMYGWGPDMNTPPALCDEVARRAGLKSRHMALAERSTYGYAGIDAYNKALLLPVGPLQMVDARTAIGVSTAVETAARAFGLGENLRIGLQGFGSVGAGTMYFLRQKGHVFTSVADASGCYTDKRGLSFDELFQAKRGGLEIAPSRVPEERRLGDPDQLFGDDSYDVLVLAAVADAMTEERARSTSAKLIVEGGNLTVTPAAHSVLKQRGIPVVPDFAASGGGIGIVSGMIQLGWKCDASEILNEISRRVEVFVARACTKAVESELSLREAALQGLPDWMRG